jgi:peptidoglycan/LPS O-acetylase OafA/YrhL
MRWASKADLMAYTKAEPGASAALSVFRFSLALMVMATHLSALTPPQTGRLAVEAFFCISGFLITMVANGRYEGRPLAFLANRFLRIYPTYWACLLIGLAVVALFPASSAIHPSLVIPASPPDWLANLGVFGLTQMTVSRILPAAWSLHTELWFYLLIGLITATRPRLTLAMLAMTLVISAYCAFWRAPIPFYGTPIGNADAFFIGSALWHWRHRLRPRWPLAIASVGFVLFEALAWAPIVVSQTFFEFLGAPATALFLLGLWNSNVDRALRDSRPLCTMLGRISYPLFLLHWPLGALVWSVSGLEPGPALWVTSGIGTVALSVAVLVLIEDPIGRLRARIRHAAPAIAPSRETMPAVVD